MDTDKGLISSSTDKGLISSSSSSSSSSSTVPARRSYRAGLSEELKSEFLRLFGASLFGDDIRCFNFDRLIEPDDLIDPDDPSSWEVHRNCRYPIRLRCLSPNHDPHFPGEKIVGSPVFELYYIKIIKLDPLREFYSIHMRSSTTDAYPMIIYNLPDGEETPLLNEPLPLKNIFRVPSALETVIIALSNPSAKGWVFWHEPNRFSPRVIYEMCKEDFKDELTDSVASISCQLIESAAVADLQFIFLDKKGRSLRILSGSIFATTDGNPDTKRLIRQFSSSSSVVLQNRKVIPVNRSVFGVPRGSSLHIQVKLIYVDRPNKFSGVEDTLTFKVPEKTQSVQKDFYITRCGRKYIAKMIVKVSWWDCIV